MIMSHDPTLKAAPPLPGAATLNGTRPFPTSPPPPILHQAEVPFRRPGREEMESLDPLGLRVLGWLIEKRVVPGTAVREICRTSHSHGSPPLG